MYGYKRVQCISSIKFFPESSFTPLPNGFILI